MILVILAAAAAACVTAIWWSFWPEHSRNAVREFGRAKRIGVARESTGPLLSRRASISIILGAIGVLFLIWLVLPAFEGFHVGYNFASDHECLTRLGLQWCR
jgi:hypothetical protein